MESDTDSPTIALDAQATDEALFEARQTPTNRQIALAIQVWIASLVYTVLIGEFATPAGVGATFVGTIWFAFLYTSGSRSKLSAYITGLSLLLCGVYSLYSNWLVVSITDLSLVTATLFLLSDTRYRRFPETPLRFLLDILDHCASLCYYAPRYCATYAGVLRIRRTPNGSIVQTTIIALFSLSLFHLFFVQINDEYANFMRPIIEALYELLTYLIDIPFLLAWLMQGLALYGLLFVTQSKPIALSAPVPHAKIDQVGVLLPITMLTAVFSLFQIKFILIISTIVQQFKDFSLYVQRGFWELLVIAAIGSIFWLSAYQEYRSPKARKILAVVLGVFLLELNLLCLFAAHKLLLLQIHFGLKDQRIFASLAVGLLLATFLMFCGLYTKKLAYSMLIRTQLVLLLTSVTLVSYVNVDAITTATYPISFNTSKGERIKDYSYLLTNSYDNTKYWTQLLEEIVHDPAQLKYPENYYWGRYYPLCSYWHGTTMNYFKNRLYHAKKAMTFSSGLLGIRQRMRFNFATYRADQWALTNSARLPTYYDVIEDHCTARPSPRYGHSY